MASVGFSNLIAVDPMPFDPATYVGQEFYAEDASGVKRRIPLSNIIRWREVKNSDGTNYVECNACFVTWSDGSLQLLIGDKTFDVSEHSVQEIQSHLFLEHWKETYQAQGTISREMEVVPSASSSNYSYLPDHVDSRSKTAGPENLTEQTEMETKLHLSSSADAPPLGSFWLYESEIEPELGHLRHEEETCNHSYIEAELHDTLIHHHLSCGWPYLLLKFTAKFDFMTTSFSSFTMVWIMAKHLTAPKVQTTLSLKATR
ncbi:hypothetical protein F511_24383 [Dorcoceras hygrometricum]|uniref:Uncharacterized protein n=1 Tax=Dorcoceras hygrometricum TaxID=472368 RepID=A0A2Z7BD49_9LAMI|nr:hypothetical protein F511_24383 [Dorcoceras hygrometricum]